MNTAQQFDLSLAVAPEATKRPIAKAYLTVYRAGRKAAEHGQKKVPPYKNHQDWRRVFRHYWVEGFSDYEHGRAERYKANY